MTINKTLFYYYHFNIALVRRQGKTNEIFVSIVIVGRTELTIYENIPVALPNDFRRDFSKYRNFLVHSSKQAYPSQVILVGILTGRYKECSN